MKVIRAKSAGFCWGVERAIQVAREEACGGERRVYTDGPLIHNKQMMDALSREDIRDAILDAPNHPKLSAGGRPRKHPLRVVKMGVFLEEPKHFHVTLKVNAQIKFLPYKEALWGNY